MLISPFTSVRSVDGRLVLSSLFHRQDVDLSSATRPQLEEAGIFVRPEQWSARMESYFAKLENQFSKSKPTLGYIETTSRCPFSCIMCPKSQNKLIRQQPVMSLQLFENILNQLKHQKVITLHLFGDPLMDPLLFERLELCRKYGIGAIFSTNIPLFKRKDVSRLFEVPIEQMIVSVDSLDPTNYTAIRRAPGNRPQDHAQNIAPFLQFLEKFRTENHQIKQLILRAVRLNLSREDFGAVRDLASGDMRIKFDLKPFIDFPKTDRPELGLETPVDLRDPILIYQALGRTLPFKCTKPWKIGELASTSDGEVLPCCLCFNGPYSLGSLKTQSLEELYFSDSYREFRRKIFFSQLDPEWLCSSCDSASLKLNVAAEQKRQIEDLFHQAERV